MVDCFTITGLVPGKVTNCLTSLASRQTLQYANCDSEENKNDEQLLQLQNYFVLFQIPAVHEQAIVIDSYKHLVSFILFTTNLDVIITRTRLCKILRISMAAKMAFLTSTNNLFLRAKNKKKKNRKMYTLVNPKLAI